MASRDEIVSFCDELLEIERFDDYGPNGLQVPGAGEVSRLATGVTATREFLARAAEAGAQLAIVHHGLLFGEQRGLSAQLAERLRVALVAELSVAAYHLPLDAHPEVGNNALLCRELGLEIEGRRFAVAKGNTIGVIGRSEAGIEAAELIAKVATISGREPLVFDAGPDRIRRLGIVSGAGSGAIEEAAALGLDGLLTGEPTEHAMGDAVEAGLHFIAAGHYATETLGVRRLGELVAERFAIEHEFIDLPNPI